MVSAGPDLAAYPRRAAATLLDGVVVGVILTFVVLVAGAAGATDLDARDVVVVGALFQTLVYAPVLLCRRGPRNGQTLGKQWLSIRVVRQDAEPVRASSALLREFISKGVLGIVPFFTFVDFLFPLGDPRRQAIHDKIASTFVVRGDAVPDHGAAAEDPFATDEPERPATSSGWAPPTAPAPPRAPEPEPAASPWAPPPSTPAPTPPPEDEDIRGPFGPSSSEPR